MKKKILSLIALGLVCVPFICNAETVDSTHIAYTENYFVSPKELLLFCSN